MNLLVTGGTGHLGREVVRAALAAGHTVRVLSRGRRPPEAPESTEWATADLVTGAGLDQSLIGTDAVVHAASDPRNPIPVDIEGTRRLADAARHAGVGHLVYVSIVGVDRIPLAYYRQKLAAERVLKESGAPYSILRATQFHSFVDQVFGSVARIPLVFPLPAGFRIQSVATKEVAGRLVRAIAEGPRGMLPDFGGPEALTLADAAAAWKTARGIRKPSLSIPVPGRTAAAFRAGHNLVSDGERGIIRWAQWLETRGQ